jgi:hypothetical protein
VDTIKGASARGYLLADGFTIGEDSGFGSYAYGSFADRGWGSRFSILADQLDREIVKRLQGGDDVQVDIVGNFVADNGKLKVKATSIVAVSALTTSTNGKATVPAGV